MDAATIGIIGGADGPTSIFIAGNPSGPVLVGALAVMAIVWAAALIIQRRHRK